MTARNTLLVCLFGGLLIFVPTRAAPAFDGTDPPFEEPAPFDALTDNKVQVVNYNPPPFTGLAVDSDGGVWWINPYLSRLGKYSAITAEPDLVADTGHNPVSIGVWEPDAETRKILVVCRGTHGMFLHDSVTGEAEDFVLLDSEPADLVIDADNKWAFVSCQGDSTVVQVSLETFTILNRFDTPVGESPGNLYLDRGDPDVNTDNRVYCAMGITGNNSTVLPPNGQLNGNILSIKGFIVDLDTLSETAQLPDEDVYRINPFDLSVTVAVKGSGSLQWDIDRNPVNGDLWILSSDSNNKDFTLNTEPLIRGDVVINQLQTLTGVTNTSSPVQAPPTGIDLDDTDTTTAGPQYDATRSVNQARTMDFLEDPDLLPGFAFIASAHSDVMIATDPLGNRVADFSLPTGAQCFSVKVWDPDERIVLALCLGTMTIEVFNWAAGTAPVGSLDIGHDPTPDQIQRGRAVFLAGKHSEDARSSCSSCHPDGDADQLGWSIPGEPCDFKDVMVTQSLFSIADSFPHHWRGERDLPDFQKAFVGLLGADPQGSGTFTEEPSDEEMEDFVVFMNSLQMAANPVESYKRELDDLQSPGPLPNDMCGSAVRGQAAFTDVENFNGNTCAECHPLETGTIGNLFAEVPSTASRAFQLESAHLRRLHKKGELDFTITEGQTSATVNINGFGAIHNGAVTTVFDFIFNTPAFSTLTDQERADCAKFVEQFDHGISPASHWGQRFVQGDPETVPADIDCILIEGTRKGWNDTVAFGKIDDGTGTLVPVRMWFNARIPPAGAFLTEDPSAAPIPWADLITMTNDGEAELIYLGLPPGNGRRFAVDPDNDGLITGVEINLGTNPHLPDHDGDGWVDGHEVANGDDPTIAQATSSDTVRPRLLSADLDFANARVAKYHVRFNEDCTYVVRYSVEPPGGGVAVRREFERKYFSRHDTFVLQHNEPSDPDHPPPANPADVAPLLDYKVEIVITDRAGNSRGPIALDDFQPSRTQGMQGIEELTHVADMEWLKEDVVGGELDAEVRVTIDNNQNPPHFDPQEGIMVLLQINVLDPVTNTFSQSDTFTSPHPSSFDVVNGMGVVTTYNGNGLPGPFIVSPLTDASGQVTVEFKQPGLSTGTDVKVSVLGTFFPAESPAGVFQQLDIARMQLLLLEDVSELKKDL